MVVCLQKKKMVLAERGQLEGGKILDGGKRKRCRNGFHKHRTENRCVRNASPKRRKSPRRRLSPGTRHMINGHRAALRRQAAMMSPYRGMPAPLPCPPGAICP